MRKLILAAALSFAALTLAPTQALAVDNSTHVIGLGADTTFSSEGILPQLSAKFALRPRLELSLQFGMSIVRTEASFTPGLKFAYVLIPERNMNLYIAGTIAVDVQTVTGLEAFLYGAGPGVEIFLSELPNLGIALEFGFRGSVTNLETTQSLTTPNESFTNLVTAFGSAGIHYYF